MIFIFVVSCIFQKRRVFQKKMFLLIFNGVEWTYWYVSISFGRLSLDDCYVLDLKEKARSISNIIYSLPFTLETKKILFDIFVGLLNGTIQLDYAIDQFAKVTFVPDKTEQCSFSVVVHEAQEKLNQVLDKLWCVVDLENITDLNDTVMSIRHLFNCLFHLIEEQEKKISKLAEDVETLKISEGELLLGSMATQLIIKCSHYLKMNEPIHITKFRTSSMLNSHENIGLLKDFLRQNGFDWNYLMIVIQMLKCRRLSAAHPSKSTTTVKDIQAAIEQVYPNRTSNDREKATMGLSILEILAKELDESLFISTEN